MADADMHHKSLRFTLYAGTFTPDAPPEDDTLAYMDVHPSPTDENTMTTVVYTAEPHMPVLKALADILVDGDCFAEDITDDEIDWNAMASRYELVAQTKTADTTGHWLSDALSVTITSLDSDNQALIEVGRNPAWNERWTTNAMHVLHMILQHAKEA